MCKKHENKDHGFRFENDNCPYCEIDRLKAELEEAQKGKKVEGYKAVCVDRDTAIVKIRELSELITKEGYRADKLVDKIEDLERQLAEAKASAEAWQENCRLTEDELEKERNKHADTIGKLAELEKQLSLYQGGAEVYIEGYMTKFGVDWIEVPLPLQFKGKDFRVLVYTEEAEDECTRIG